MQMPDFDNVSPRQLQPPETSEQQPEHEKPQQLKKFVPRKGAAFGSTNMQEQLAPHWSRMEIVQVNSGVTMHACRYYREGYFLVLACKRRWSITPGFTYQNVQQPEQVRTQQPKKCNPRKGAALARKAQACNLTVRKVVRDGKHIPEWDRKIQREFEAKNPGPTTKRSREQKGLHHHL